MATQVKILCDSCADLPRELLAARNIGWIPFTVSFGTESLADGIDMTAETFYDRVSQSAAMPTTSQVTPVAYGDFFTRATADGSQAIYIGLSSGVSGSIQNAFMAANAPGLQGRVHVVDSLGASVGLGLMVLHAADLAAAGASAGEIVTDLTEFRTRMCHVFTLDTLEYARKSGRISALSAIAAGVLDVKPVLHMDMEGKLVPIDRARGRKRALKRLLDEIDRLEATLSGRRAGVSHAHAPEEAADLAAQLKARGAAEVIIGEIGPVIGTHTGPGCISIFFEGPAGRGDEA